MAKMKLQTAQLLALESIPQQFLYNIRTIEAWEYERGDTSISMNGYMRMFDATRKGIKQYITNNPNEALWIELPFSFGSDYSGDYTTKSNYQVWKRDYAKRQGKDWLDVSSGFSIYGILVKLAALVPESEFANAFGLVSGDGYYTLDDEHEWNLRQEIILDDWADDRCNNWLDLIATQAQSAGVIGCYFNTDDNEFYINEDLFPDELRDELNAKLAPYVNQFCPHITKWEGTPIQWLDLLQSDLFSVYLDEHYDIETGCLAYLDLKRFNKLASWQTIASKIDFTEATKLESLGQQRLFPKTEINNAESIPYVKLGLPLTDANRAALLAL